MFDRSSQAILHGPLGRELARFGTPLALGMALQNLFNLVDTYLIACLLPEEVGPALGALGICDQVAALGTILSYGVSTAAGALVSHQKGAGSREAVRRTAWQSTAVVGLLSALFGLLGLGLAPFVVRDLIGAKGAVGELATRYLRVMGGGSFSIFFLLHFTTLQRALGSSKTPAFLLVASNALNILFAIVLIFGQGPSPAVFAWGGTVAKLLHIPRMGVMGAAWATLFARMLALVPLTLTLVWRFRLSPLGWSALKKSREEFGHILQHAWPISAQMGIRVAAMLLVSAFVAHFFTTPTDQTASVALGLVFRLDTLALFIATGWGGAAQTFVGQNLGAKQAKRAYKSGWIAAGYDAVTGVLLAALLFQAGEAILRIFVSTPSTLAIACSYLRIVAPSYVGLGIGVVLGHALIGAGATHSTFRTDLALIVGLEVPLLLLAALERGTLEGLFSCIALTNIASGLVYAAIYRWKRQKYFRAIPS